MLYLSSLFALAFSGTVTAKVRPNIILIMADDMGYGDPSYVSKNVLQANGNPHPDQGWIQTPHMDAMAAAGISFSRFYAASAVCSPTRGSCLTGRNPFRLGIPYANKGSLRADESPLSELLSDAGYATGHFGKWHLGTMTTLRKDANRGKAGVNKHYSPPWHYKYDTVFATESKVPTYHPYRKTINGLSLPLEFKIDPEIGYFITDKNFYGTHYWRAPLNPKTAPEGKVVQLDEVNNTEDGDDSKLMTDEALKFMEDSVAKKKPFFAVIWYHTPHTPLVDPEQKTKTYPNNSLKASIEDMDAQIGNIRKKLKELNVSENTMVWLTSDNGPEKSVDSPNEKDKNRSIRSGGLKERKRSLFEGGIRVPGILEWPNEVKNSGRSTAFLSSTSDYYTTILDYLDLSTPNQKALDGISLRPVLENTSETRTPPIGFLIKEDKSWTAQDHKLVNIKGKWALYDMTLPDHQLEQDPLATEADISKKPEEIQNIFNELLAGFKSWKSSVDSDDEHISKHVPNVTLTASQNNSADKMSIEVKFNQTVYGLSTEDFYVQGAIVDSLKGSDDTYTLTLTQKKASKISLKVPAGSAFTKAGVPNSTSRELTIE